MPRRLPLLPLFFMFAAAAQQTPTPYTFQGNTRLVVETVTATDALGNPIRGLTARDFVITEDGKPQTISFCDFQAIRDDVPPPTAPASPPRAPSLPPLTTFQIAPETPGNTRYTGRRLVALYFDMTAMQPSEQLRALAAAQRFVNTDLRPADMVAVMDYRGAGVQVEQDFTADRGALNETIGKLYATVSDLGFGQTPTDSDAADLGAAFGQDDSEFNIFNNNRELAALQSAVEMLAPISEKKSMVYFASGLSLHQVDNEAQLESTIDAAIRANVNLFPVDSRGLVASAPLGDATQSSPGGVSMYDGTAFQDFNLRRQQSQDALYALGRDTGGKALLDTNNLAAGIVRARDAIASYYILGYYTSNAALDGKYRRVKVSLAGHPGARLDFRSGYYAGKVFAKFSGIDKERQLEDALALGDPITDLNLGLQINYFQMNSAEYFVPVTVEIPGSELAQTKKHGANQVLIDFIGEVKDPYGLTVTNLRDKAELKLSGATAAELAQAPLAYNTGFTLLPGSYSIKVLARDADTGRIGTYMTEFTIPNLGKVADRVPMSSVVLSRERVPLSSALFNATKNTAQDPAEAANPLVQNGAELIPSVARTFSRAGRMFVYFQAYEHVPTPLVAYVAFYRNQSKVHETAPQAITASPQGRAGAMPVSFSVPLAGLAPGRYTCQVTVLDPATQRANFWRAEIAIVP